MELYVPFFPYPRVEEFADIVAWRVIDPIEKIRTGDILLFSGSGFVSNVIKIFTISRWNHIGMACWCELKHKSGKTSVEFFCFELGSQPYTDLMTRKIMDKKVRLVRLADISGMYDCIAYRGLNIKRDSDFPSRFKKFMLKYSGTPFITSALRLAKIHLITPGAKDNETTCSILTGKMIHELGFYKINYCPSQLAPDHFSSSSQAFPDSLWKGKEVVIYRDSKWIKARLVFITLIVIILIALIYVIFMKSQRREAKRGSTR
jgi:hypothetical protein